MKKLLIIIFLFVLVDGLLAELDWIKGVQVDVRPAQIKKIMFEYPGKVSIQTEYNTKYDPFLIGLQFKTNYSVERLTNDKIIINATISTYKGHIISIILLLVFIIILGFIIINRMRRKNK